MIEKLRNHPFLKNPSPNSPDYGDFQISVKNLLSRVFLMTYEVQENPVIPWFREHPMKTKLGIIIREVSHDINEALLYYYPRKDTNKPSFDFLDFWEQSLSPLLDMIGLYESGKDHEIPEDMILKHFRKGELVDYPVSIYNPSGTPWWRLAKRIKRNEVGPLLETLKPELSGIREEISKCGKPLEENDYRKRWERHLSSEVNLLEGKITNDESDFLVIEP